MTDKLADNIAGAGSEPAPASEPAPSALVVEPPARPAKASRLPALTGLRGVAAIAVVVSHILNTTPALVHPQSGTLAWWAAYTPINIFADGDESVLLFYVLSGFVLSRPLTDGNRKQSYLSYYPRRLLRLYPPLWAALFVTFLFTLIESRHNIPAATYWTNNHSNFHVSTLQDAVLPRVGTTFDGPLWSLHWEILFSLTLPLYVWLGRYFKRFTAVKVGAVLLVLLLAAVDAKVSNLQVSDAILYAPMFGVGVVMAFYEIELVTLLRSFMARSGWIRIGLFAVVFVTGDLTHETSPIEGVPGIMVTAAHGFGVIGAALLILMIIAWQPYQKTLELRPIDWLGTRSFSLYLIHDAILITIALWLGGHPNPFLMLVLVLPSCLIGVAIFYRLVERPTQNLSNNVGKSVQKRVNQRRAEKLQGIGGSAAS
jgi:peptidoglycan/LPS O-acetylase OafA/YrhL